MGYLKEFLDGSEGRPDIVCFLDKEYYSRALGQSSPSEQKDIRMAYLKFLTMKNQFYSIVKTALMFSNLRIFFPIKLDFRGRVYAGGHPLSPFGNKQLTRKLLRFEDSEMQSFDVHAQGFQILALLASDHETLSYTRFLEFELGESYVEYMGKPDLYLYLANLFENQVMFGDERNENFPGEEFEKIIQIVSTRSIFKYILMSAAYGESLHSRFNYFLHNPKLVGLFEKIGNEKASQFAWFLSKEIDMLLSIKLSKIDVFKIMFKKLVRFIQTEAKKPFQLKINVDGGFSFNSYYVKTISTDIRLGSAKIKFLKPEKRLNSDLELENVMDGRKFNRSLLPNFVRAIDAAVIKNVLQSYQANGWPILTIHDALYVSSKESKDQKSLRQSEYASEAYSDALFRVFKNDPIKRIVLLNGVE